MNTTTRTESFAEIYAKRLIEANSLKFDEAREKLTHSGFNNTRCDTSFHDNGLTRTYYRYSHLDGRKAVLFVERIGLLDIQEINVYQD